MNKVNELVICKDNYETQQEFENAIRDAVMLLLKANYISVISYDEKGFGIVKIEYNYDKKEYGDRYPYWLYPEEKESIDYEDCKES